MKLDLMTDNHTIFRHICKMENALQKYNNHVHKRQHNLKG